MTQGSLCAESDAKEAECTPAVRHSRRDQTQAVLQGTPESVALRTIVYDPQADGFAALKSEWNLLLQRSRYNTIFLTHEWQTTWWECLGEGDLWIVAFRRSDTNELVGIAPFIW